MKSIKFWIILLTLASAQLSFAMLNTARGNKILKRTQNSRSVKSRPFSSKSKSNLAMSNKQNTVYSDTYALAVADVEADIANSKSKIAASIPSHIYPLQFDMSSLLAKGIDLRNIKHITVKPGSIIVQVKDDLLKSKKGIASIEDVTMRQSDSDDEDLDALMEDLANSRNELAATIKNQDTLANEQSRASKKSFLSRWITKKTIGCIGLCACIGYLANAQWQKRSETQKKISKR